MTTVADIMTRGVLSIRPDSSLDVLADALTQAGLEGAPVRDPMGRVYGMVSKTDLLNRARTTAPEGESGEDLTVEDVMTPVVLAVKDTDPAMDAAKRMVDAGVHRLLVVDELEHPVGIVTPMDVLKALVDGRLAAS